jgi:hypothetical protein
MDDLKAKLQIKIGEIEISLEGDSEFVSQHYDKVEKQLEAFLVLSNSINSSKANISDNPASSSVSIDEQETVEVSDSLLHNSFGEWLNVIPRETSDTDKALLAGYYTQVNNEAGTFRSRDVSKLLKEHSIKLSNVSVFVKNLEKTKKTFQHSKSGSEANYKVSRTTEEELKKLLQ